MNITAVNLTAVGNARINLANVLTSAIKSWYELIKVFSKTNLHIPAFWHARSDAVRLLAWSIPFFYFFFFFKGNLHRGKLSFVIQLSVFAAISPRNLLVLFHIRAPTWWSKCLFLGLHHCLSRDSYVAAPCLDLGSPARQLRAFRQRKPELSRIITRAPDLKLIRDSHGDFSLLETRAHACTRVHRNTHTHTYMHTRIHTHTHT